MAFDAQVITLSFLAVFNLPGHTMRICDGGTVLWGADRFNSSDPDFGTIGEAEELTENVGDEMPSASLTFYPASTAAAATLSSPDYQGAVTRIYLAEVDTATGTVDGTPELLADMQLDTTALVLGRGTRKLEMGFVAAAQRLFLFNEGNTLTGRFHKSVWPGELGLDNATGKTGTIAWGTQAPPRGTTASGVAGGSGGFAMNMLEAMA
jgi:hypothetical protein